MAEFAAVNFALQQRLKIAKENILHLVSQRLTKQQARGFSLKTGSIIDKCGE